MTKIPHVRNRVLRLWAGALVIALLAGGCSQPDGSVGSAVGGGPIGEPFTTICPALDDTSFAVAKTGTGGSAHLYTGLLNQLGSVSLLRFNRPVKPYEMRVDSARFDLAWEGSLGAGAFPVIEADLVSLKWTESTPPARDDIPAGRALTPRMLSTSDSGFMQVPLDTAEVNSWLGWFDSSSVDTGWHDPNRADSALTLFLEAPGAVDRIVRFRSRGATSDSLRPYLLLFATVRDSAGGAPHPDTIRIGAAGDLFIAHDFNPFSNTRLVVGSGAGFRSALSFDMSYIWNRQTTHHLVVNRAVLTLTRDRSMFTWLPWTKSIWPYRMTSRKWMTQPDSSEFSGFILTPTAVDSTIDTLQLVVTTPAAGWARGDSTNFGLLLESTGEGLDIDRIAYYGADDPDPSKRPRLTVYYTELPR
jgi:hypothetical protein